MGVNSKERKNQKYTEEDLIIAVQKVKEGMMSLREAENIYKIPRSTTTSRSRWKVRRRT